MSHTFTFKVQVELERESGKFMARDEMEDALADALQGADVGSVDGGPDGDSVYNVAMWDVEVVA